MRITELISVDSVKIGGTATDKNDVITQLVDLVSNSGAIADKEAFARAVSARESNGSTGVGEGVAIPHAKSEAVTKPAVAVLTLPAGVDFDSIDGQPVKVALLIASPDDANNIHLDVLSRLSSLLLDPGFIGNLKAAKTAEDFINVVDKAESAKFIADAKAAESNKVDLTGAPLVLAVTACKTGVALTYIAAESLSNAALAKKVNLIVETDGASGIGNALTAEDIKAAQAIIVAADRAVETERFSGKKVITTSINDSIARPGELIEQALA
ncbi:MAG: fructose PTS transporter subunit IIA [Clostridiales Family XIII bacterium]|jgi:PTS system fructose-specific IIC component|nr:fructose PTS transporter subunit IIA [Clostridiales Family XIII bacterium]